MIKGACWNIRGLNDRIKQGEVNLLILKHNIAFVGLLETRVRMGNRDRVTRMLPKGWSSVTNHSNSLIGRIWVLWNPNFVQFTVIGISNQTIQGSVTIVGGRPLLSKAMAEFEHCIRKREIEDLRQTGHLFSWNNKRTESGAVAKKIDRGLGNLWWFKEFSDLKAQFLRPGISDHSPCILPF
ncbi:hypothetical protein CFOL_v3_18773 [Cephalotus follicularis]|uniref:Exo_endo_phos domain-containing protein n=1 Tax=Cephalotus follicularis TaxID=3775 RepID=A0A1Q3C525_CEPFO|nr:hypothetical protein CFOL_v3_18773 [Cephalotus follicularis]